MSPADAILAALLAAQTPGLSPYSQIVLETCDEACQQRPRCQRPVLYCRPPRYSPSRKAYVRYETWAEGVERYALIADIVSDTATRMSWQPRDDCPPPHHGAARDEDEGSDVCRAAYRQRPWPGDTRRLRLFVASVLTHESTLRRDVHEGSTRGDCDHVVVDGHRRVVPGSCRSHCLGQVMVPKGETTRRGYHADELVGVDRASTRRCVETVIDRLSDAHVRCTHQNSGAPVACTFGIYGGVPGWGDDPRIAARAETYRTLAAVKAELSDEVLAALGRDE